MSKKVTIIDVKQALKDSRFRDSLPSEIKEEVNKYLQNPGCPCNTPLYKKILTDHKKSLQDYFPGREIGSPADELKKIGENNWTVINCNINEIEDRLKKLPPGRKQIQIARFEDQATVIVNELNHIF